MPVNIAKDLKLFYVNQLGSNKHMHEDPVHGTSDILDMAFLSPGLSSRDVSVSVADDHMGSDHFPHPNFIWKATQMEYTTYRTMLPI